VVFVLATGRCPLNMGSEAVMRTGSALLAVWLIIGVIASGSGTPTTDVASRDRLAEVPSEQVQSR